MDDLAASEENLWFGDGRVKTVDNKYLEFYSNGPNLRLWIKGSQGGSHGTCLLDEWDIKHLINALTNYISKIKSEQNEHT